jgi:orotidine-5'-phosphate decarboxylase
MSGQPNRIFTEIRKVVPDSFLLFLEWEHRGKSFKYVNGMNANVGLLINSSRGIIYASEFLHFAREKAEQKL